MNIKDIIQSTELGDGFCVFQIDEGYFIGVRGIDGKMEHIQKIDRHAFNRVSKIEGQHK